MKREDLSRRDFHRLTAAAVGGIMAGTLAGCGGAEEEAANGGGQAPAGGGGAQGGTTPAGSGTAESTTGEQATHDVALLLEEPHVCRGLNTCMGKGKGDNACAGQGACATVEAHGCHGQNACKGQGGCEEIPGQNTCSGKGNCGVPLGEDAWKKARAAFEKVWAEKNPDKELGAAPEA